MTGERRWAIAGYAYALAVTAVLSYFLLDIPIQLTDSFGNMLKLQGVSLRELVQAEFWQRAYLRPFLWAELKLVFDLANGDYFTWFRGVHVAQVGLLTLLYVRLVRPRSALDCACLPLGLAALLGLHTFTGTVIEAFPINTFLTILVCVFAAAALALSPYRWWNDVAAAALTIVAALTVESGLLVCVIIVAAALMRAPGVSRAGVAAQLVLLAGYFVLRFQILDVGTPGLEERASGFGWARLEPEELARRFGANPLPFYLYNVVASVLSVLFSEPRGGVWSVTLTALGTVNDPAMTVNAIASLLGTALIGWFAWRRRAAWRAGDLTNDDRLVLLFAVVLLANGVISYPYTKDVVMSPAGAFFALALFAAARHALGHGRWRGWRAPLTAMLAVVLSVSWSVRYVGLHAQLRDAAYQVREEWALADSWVVQQFGESVLRDPAADALKRRLRNEAVYDRPSLRPRLTENRWTQLLERN